MKANFPLELDHIFVWVQPKAPEAAIFAELGLQQSHYREHIGQDTASCFFFFENAYLELLWINDEQEARDNAARTGLDGSDRANWQKTGASPFGIGWHRVASPPEKLTLFPVKYWAEWMQPETYIELSETFKQTTEPLNFIVPEYMSYAERRQNPENIFVDTHPLGVKKLTSVQITLGQTGELSPTAEEVSRHTSVAIQPGNSSLLQLTFDSGRIGKTLDARPTLPIILKC